MTERKLGDAEQVAEKIVRDEGLALPIDVLSLAATRGIHVVAKPASAQGVSGMLIRSGEQFAIAYATHIRSEGFQRFSIAHELGHYFLEGHPEAVFRGSDVHESRAGFTSSDQYEREADHFAAALLMPSHLFDAAAGRYSDGLEAIKGLAGDCRTSLTASAIRYIQLIEAAVAIVLSHGSTVDYCFASEAVRRTKGYRHLRKGAVLPRDSLTRDFNQDPKNIASASEDSDSTELNLWFHTDDEIAASEEVIGLGDYGKTLTVITADIPDDDEHTDSGWSAPRFKY
ncbi:ImmA/IrrE family metallo-endopeptidase [Burkholderia ambifaria]|uniref:ImmA/IrrE family metallo-endopeptidase n=1 Tax=Burkholderia ambifaria TaxID=152480 RepID=UPI00158C1496|nr:ImmA/IrrE family metallo-endopeptidase [Burkholderia ambifaria]